MYETLTDIIHTFPNMSNLIDAQCAGGHAQRSIGLKDNLANQMDFIDAALISLGTKISAIRDENGDQVPSCKIVAGTNI